MTDSHVLRIDYVWAVSKRNKYLLLSLMITLCFALGASAKSSIPNRARYVILNEDTTEQYFIPTNEVLKSLFKKISNVVRSSKKKSYRGKLLKMKHYVFQVYTEIDEHEQRIIFVHGLCNYGKVVCEDWREEVIFVEDGGACFFNVEYNLSQDGKFSLTYGCGSP